MATNGVDIMMRKIAIALAAVAVVTAGSTLSASAMHGGHGGGFGGGHGGGFGGGHFGGHFGGFGHPGMAGPGAFGGRPAMFHGNHFIGNRFAFNRFAFRDRDRFFHHRFFRHRFAFLGAGFPYGSYDGCYSRVWTPWGWRWRYVCY